MRVQEAIRRIARPEVQDMFHLGFGEVMQAEREREIAELVRQRRLLQPHEDGRGPADVREPASEKQAPRVRAQTAGG